MKGAWEWARRGPKSEVGSGDRAEDVREGGQEGTQTEVRGAEEDTGREMQPRAGCRNVEEEIGGRSAEEVEGKWGLQRS